MATEQNASDVTAVPRFSLRTLLVFILVASLCLASVSFVRQRAARRAIELTRLAQLDKVTLQQVVKDVEGIRDKIGRAPKDKGELESLLGRPLPVVHDNGHPTPILYRLTGRDSFQLMYTLWATDDWVYDSKQPDAGWVQHYY
jgi:hypothetical protein